MLEPICLQFWKGQLTVFEIHGILYLNTYLKFCQVKLYDKISLILRVKLKM